MEVPEDFCEQNGKIASFGEKSTPKLEFMQRVKQRERSNNWLRVEKEVLMEQCTKNYNVLHGSLSTKLTAEKKNELWKEIK